MGAKGSQSEYLLDLQQCGGTLRWDGGELAVTADVTVDDKAEIAIVVPSAPMSPQLFALVSQALDTECSIELESSSGQSVRSQHVWLVEPNLANGALILGCSELWLTTPIGAAASGPEYEYLVRGLRCMGSVRADFDFGHVAIGGRAEFDDRVCGRIVVTPRVGLSAEDVDTGVDRVLDILSFASGHRLQVSMRRQHVGKDVELRIWPHEAVARPMWPPFHFADLASIVTAAARTSTRELWDRTGVGVAIQWTRAYSSHEAVRFVQLMVAMEHLLECSKARVARLPGTAFEELRVRLENVLNEFIDSPAGHDHGAERQDLLEGIRLLNQPVLRKGIARLLNEYRVPYEDLAESIGPIVKLRNKLVHQGVDPPRTGEDVLEFELLLRELLTRTFLAILEFEGTYRSWVDGPKDVSFCRTPEPTLR